MPRRNARSAIPTDGSTDDTTAASPAPDPAPAPRKRENPLIAIVPICVVLACAIGFLVHKYGTAILMSDDMKELRLDGPTVDGIIAGHTFLHVGGPHRGGTTVLWECLRTHPDMAGFGNKVGADASEGIFMQSVYPQFGIGNEVSASGVATGRSMQRSLTGKGLGQYAFSESSHYTEEDVSDPKDRQALRRKLFRQWGGFWDYAAHRVLLEKSPPNMVISRFLNALWTSGGGEAHFVMTTRHPLAVTFAHHQWSACASLSVFELVLHWLVSMETMRADLGALPTDAYTLVQFEEFAKDPDATLNRVYAAVGLAPHALGDAVTVRPDTNAKYRTKYCRAVRDDPAARAKHDRLVSKLGGRVKAFGYDLDAWTGEGCV